MSRAAIAIACSVLVLAAAGGGRAQEASAGQEPAPRSAREEQARALFLAGTEALREASFAEARDLLRASLALAPRYATGFNLAVALRGTGELCEAVSMFERLDHGELGEPRETREEVRRYLREVSAQAAELRVEVRGPASATVRLDGLTIGRVRRGEVFARCTDPGRHVVEGGAEGHARAEEIVSLERGGSALVTLTLVADAPRAEEPRGILQSPVFWVVAGVVVAAGGAAAIWAVSTSERSPTDAPLGVLEI